MYDLPQTGGQSFQYISSASDSTSGGILSGEQGIITESIERQRIIVFTPTRSADPDLQKACSALNWGFAPNYETSIVMFSFEVQI